MDLVALIAHALLMTSGLLCIGRLALGPSLADRILAVDCLLVAGVVGIGVEAARTGGGAYLDILLVVALVAFTGTTAVARFIERKGPP